MMNFNLKIRRSTIRKAEHRRIDAFELWYWRSLLRVPWTAGRSNQSILKEISPESVIGRTDAEAEAPIPWPPDELTHLKRPMMLGFIGFCLLILN